MDSFDAKLAKALDDLAKPPVVDCVECGDPIVLTNRARLYCSEVCHQTLKLIHYGRGVVADGRIVDPLVEDAIGMRIAHILAGGYHEQARRVPPATRAQIFERDGGRCVLCGEPATQIDHAAGDANTPENLRAVCGSCNLAMAQEHLVPASPEKARLARRLIERIFASAPLFPRDDETAWPATSRRLMAERRDRLSAHRGVRKLMERAAATGGLALS